MILLFYISLNLKYIKLYIKTLYTMIYKKYPYINSCIIRIVAIKVSLIYQFQRTLIPKDTGKSQTKHILEA